MNNFSRERGKTLIIVEGKYEKDIFFQNLFNSFPELKLSIDNVIIYGTNIYNLSNSLINEYGESWDDESIDIDLPFLCSCKEHRLWRKDFTNVYLVFDFEGQAPNFDEAVIRKFQKKFSNVTDNGKLFINYPMIEAYMDVSDLNSINSFINKQVKLNFTNGKDYKNSVKATNKYLLLLMQYKSKTLKFLKDSGLSDNDCEIVCDKLMKIAYFKENLESEISNIFSDFFHDNNLINITRKAIIKIEKLSLSNGLNYYEKLREIYITLIKLNILKCCNITKISVNEDNRPGEQYNNINMYDILNEQLITYNHNMNIYVLATCLFIIPEYNSQLIK